MSIKNSTVVKYAPFLVLSFFIILFSRLVSWFYVDYTDVLLQTKSMVIGALNDVFFNLVFWLCLLPLYLLLYRLKPLVANITFYALSFFNAVITLSSVFYFSEVGQLLDVFVYYMTFQEMLETALSFEYAIPLFILFLVVFVILCFLSPKLVNSLLKLPRLVRCFALVGLVLVLIGTVYLKFRTQKYADYKLQADRTCKSEFFLQKSLSCVYRTVVDRDAMSVEIIKEFQNVTPSFEYVSERYPYLRRSQFEDVLSPFFNLKDTPPNIYIIITEGLANDYVDSLSMPCLMPFLDSLKNDALYFDNFFTLGERSFAAVPCLLGSLPHGKIGFTMETELPHHNILFKYLESLNYQNVFFYGQESNFHKKKNFLQTNDIDLVFDKESFDSKYEKIVVGNPPYFWGYDDKSLFQSLYKTVSNFTPNVPVTTTVYTGSMHSPFQITDEDIYKARVREAYEGENDDLFVEDYMKYLKTIPFTDDAFRDFFNAMKNTKDYDNSIFFITGDHPMTEVPIKDNIKRYHVPLIISSPLLKSSKTISSVSSFLDVAPSILGLLESNYQMNMPDYTTMLGVGLDTTREYINTKTITFMNNSRQVVDIISGDYYLSDEKLFYLSDGINSAVSTDDPAIADSLSHALKLIEQINKYHYKNNLILPVETLRD